MTKKLITELKRQIRTLNSVLYTVTNIAEERRNNVRGIIPYIEESGTLDYITRKVIELRSLCTISLAKYDRTSFKILNKGKKKGSK